MIINCIKCNKKFEVDSSLIPDSGRNVQCGSCNYTWFYKKDIDKSKIINKNESKDLSEETFLDETNQEFIGDKIDQNQLKKDTKIPKTYQKEKSETQKKTSAITLGRILSYLIVTIISFIALIIFLDTFKSPLSKILPDLELFLYNLFETIKDIFLFIKNLTI